MFKSSKKSDADDLSKVRDIEELHKAAKSGDCDVIKSCDFKALNIDGVNSKGLTALHLACREGNFDVVAELLQRGANIETTTKKRNSPLHVAALGGKLEVVKKLLEHGADVNKLAENGMTPLYMAAQENHIDVAKELLAHGADAHLAASGGFEPVDVAIQQRHSEMTAFLMEQGSKRGFKALHVIARKDACNAAALLLSNGYDPNITAPNGYTPLHLAAKYGSINTALLLIESSANVDAAAKHNITPLHVASKHGQAEVVSLLIEAGTKLDVLTKDGLTPLHCAARDGHEHCVELLLVHNACLNAKTKHGLTALHMAAQGNHVNCANLLLGHGCHIDSPTTEGVSPLHVAAHYGNSNITQLLLDRGADVDRKARNGYTALHVACKKNRDDIVQLLIRYGANVHLKNMHGQTALHLAAYFGMVNIVLILIQNGTLIEERTIREETSLHIACRTKQINVARLLLRNEAAVDPRSKTGETPLLIASRQGSQEIASLLLAHGADPDATNKDESTSLHIAARFGCEAIVECLLEHGAKIDSRNKQKCTPLHEATRRGHLDIVKMLVDKKADVNAEAKNNLRPLHFGCHYRHVEVSVFLMDNQADLQATAKNGFTPLHIVSKNNALDLAHHLLSKGVDADTTTKTGISALHLAAKEGCFMIADALLENGASPGIQTRNGLTPLHLAARYNQLRVAKKLVKYAAPINAQTPNGYTPLHYACFYGNDEIVKLLLEEGANVEAKTKQANTPLHIAALTGHSSTIEILLKYNAPANTLNKDGFTALYIAEVTRRTVIVETLIKVTQAVIKTKEIKLNEDVKLSCSSPEELEETQLIEAADESYIEASKDRLIVNEDFEESFLGLSESSLIDAGNESVASYRTAEYEENLFSVSESPEQTTETLSPTFEAPLAPEILISSESEDRPESIMEMEPTIVGGFLISFLVDARGGIFESRQTGIRVTIPRGACEMPTRIMCKLLRSSQKVPMPKLYINEGLVSRVVEVAPQGLQFLKPIIMELPHFGSLRKRERELIVLRSDPDSDFWREHVATRIQSEGIDEEAFGEMPSSPEHGYKSGRQFVKIVSQDLPERFAVVSRPRKEKFLMFPEGGVIKSCVLPKAQVIFKETSLNTSTKVILQIQFVNELLLDPADTAKYSSIIRLQPHVKLANPVNVTMPCPWITTDHSYGVPPNLRLLAMMPANENEVSENSQWTWSDVTDVCSVTASENCCHFQTTYLTTYWLCQDDQTDEIPRKVESLYPLICGLPFLAKFVVFARALTVNSAEMRVFCMTDGKTERALEKREGFVEIARSGDVEVHDEQTVYLKCNATTSPDIKSLKLTFKPFRENRLVFRATGLNSRGPWAYRLGFISSLRTDADGKIPLICSLEAVVTEKMVRSKMQIIQDSYWHQVSDNLLQTISHNIGEVWKILAKNLHMNDNEIQGVIDLSSDQHVLAALTMLELWRSTRGEDASFEVLRDALEQTGRGDLCDLVECKSPVALPPRRIHDNPSVSRDTKPVEAISLDSVFTSEKRAGATEGFRFDFPTNEFRKNEVSAFDVGPVIGEQGPRIDTQGSLGQNESEEQITEQFMERDKSEIDFQELMGNDEQFYDSYEPTVAEDSTTRGERAANLPIDVEEDSSCEGVVELEEKPQLIMQKKDICSEDTFEEAIVNDVRGSLQNY
ncbi:ankyrin-3-like isoform X3 [Rhopilema esculentum]|uniref:ankyrin-3-like isoform X3 n=1 Tax=Rhopilema esculentum TaxID=499914 RepID=UPI0031DB5D38